MAKTVINAFDEFMKKYVNLEPEIVLDARKSRDNLLDNISELGKADDFFDLYKNYNVHFGSFSRRTKCRELDDMDLMIGISANGATYNENDPWDNVKIMASKIDKIQRECANEDGTLNSTKVLNKFKKKLENVKEYSRSDVNKRYEAVVLNLKSKKWSFDIVPCFHTVIDSNGKDYYIIPNGNGNWKKTDPRKDKEHVTNTNQEKSSKVLELVRLCKKWNKVKNAKTIPSYLLETIIINYCDSVLELSQYIDINFKLALKFISDNISLPVYDLKGIQGNINNLDILDKYNLKCKAKSDYEKAFKAGEYENLGDYKNAIKLWCEILGEDFPKYE